MVRLEKFKELRVPLALSFFAPVSVVFCLLVLRSVWWTLAVYQVGICLIFPCLESILTRKTWRHHVQILGLVSVARPGKSTTLSGSFSGLFSGFVPALVLGLASALVTGAFLVLTRETFLSPEHLQSSLATWGVVPKQSAGLLLTFALINAPAEELFWRGYLPGRLAHQGFQPHQMKILTIFLPALLYTSYHAVTISHLFDNTAALSIMISGILMAGLVWGWIRQRTGSVWPALLSHSGAVLAYLGYYFWITR